MTLLGASLRYSVAAYTVVETRTGEHIYHFSHYVVENASPERIVERGFKDLERGSLEGCLVVDEVLRKLDGD